jgi:predicted DCC family thiol-disulfide oxidoreductase YuxK
MEHAVEDIAEKPTEKPDANTAYRVLYDGQCEICQACVSWLKALDHENKTVCLPISAEVLPVDARLSLDKCLRQLHVITPEGEIHVGWDAVACLARLFPSTSIIGAAGRWFPFRNVVDCSMGSLLRTDIPSANVGAARATLPNQKRFGDTQNWVRSGRATHWASSFDCRLSSGRASRQRCREQVSLPERTTGGSICSTESNPSSF